MTDRPDPSLLVLYPGSFDPIHLGHVDVIEQALELFGSVAVAVMHNPAKPSGLFPVEQRVDLARDIARPPERRDRRGIFGARGAGARVGPASTSWSRVCAHRATSRSSSRWRRTTTPSPASARSTSPAPRRSATSAAASSGRSRKYGGAIGHLVPAPVADALHERFADPTTPDRPEPNDELRRLRRPADDYDDIDDEYPDPGTPGGYVGDAETLLRRAIDIVATAPTMPLSSSPRIDRDEIIELLEESLHRLPDELRQARWMLKERQEFVAKTRREADELLEAARVRAERMVQRTEVVRAAEQRARQVMETAEADSRRLKHETEDFLDQRLGSFEILLDKLSKTVHAGPSAPVDRRDPRRDDEHRRGRPDDGLLRPGRLRR